MSTSRIVRRSVSAPRYATMPTEPRSSSRGGGTAAIGREARAELSQVLRDVMLAAADAVEANCPVRTGHLLSNFILATGSPHSGVVGSPESVSYAAQDAGRARVLEYDVGRDGRVYYTNEVDYLKYQTPFVTDSLMAGVAAAPRGMKTRARAALKAMAKTAFRGGK